MDFLSHARIPFVEDSVISPTTQSVIAETFVWAALFTIYAQIGNRLLRALYRNTPIWKEAHKVAGVFLGNGRDDAVLFTIFGLHHGLAAYLMHRGMVTTNPTLWRHGYLLEVGFEVADLFAMAMKIYPYNKFEGFKQKLKPALLAHHVPGITLSYIILCQSDLYENVHLEAIVFYLLAGGFISNAFGVYTYTLDYSTQMIQAAVLYNANVLYFLYCRHYKFPTEAYLLVQDAKVDPQLQGTVSLYILYAAGVFMTIFNIGILGDVLPKCSRYIRRAMDGTTPIDIEPVPSSRDSMIQKDAMARLKDRRRSSAVMFLSPDLTDHVGRFD